MSRVDKPTVDEIDRLITLITGLAGENLMGLSDPSFEFIPDKPRGGASAIHRRLKAELRALLELRTIYGDMIACRILASEYPWARGELSPYQHLKLAWSHFARLTGLFDQAMKKITELHNETLDLLGVDIQRAVHGSVNGAAPSAEPIGRDTRAGRWYEVAPDPEPPTFGTMRIASEWSDAARPFADYYGAARGELLDQIDATVGTVASAIASFLSQHGEELMDLIGRYNVMVRNFRVLRDKNMP